MRPKVISLKGKRDELGPQLENTTDMIYVGRRQTQGGWKFNKHSEFHNEYTLKKHGIAALELFRKDFMKRIGEQPEYWIPKLMELRGKTLACWCKPAPCHADVIADVVEKLWLGAEDESILDELVAEF